MSNLDKDILVEVTIKAWTGNMVRFDYNNDGSRDLLDVPYRERGKNAHFRLPTGKKKVEYFHSDLTDEMILLAISKKYSNFKFTLNNNQSKQKQ